MKIVPLKKSREFFPVLSMFDEFMNNFWAEETNGKTETRGMAIDVIENDKEFVIKANVPGFKKENVRISVQDNQLTIAATREEEKVEDTGTIHRCERYSGNFIRSLYLPESCDGNKITAKLEDGILVLNIPKKETQPQKQIAIE
ncbi:MAG TPA: Hsp20/alpha crystallin family protein [Candidatus Cloacimonadota bacterium]|nr:Hsp20/alpha crystallin family protein [Candidatus Cloacimonadota bacterium]